jgi:F5/8 type C domain/Putative Ig domain
MLGNTNQLSRCRAILAAVTLVVPLLGASIGGAAPALAATATRTAAAVAGSDCAAPVRGAALSRAGWVASSNTHPTSADAPANALDGNPATGFRTDEPQAGGLFFEVDLGSRQTFDELAMDSPSSPSDYARGYYIEVSDNASSWTIVANCTGTATPQVVSFPSQTARYVAVALAASNPNWWSIDEFNLYTAAGAPPAITSPANLVLQAGTYGAFTVTTSGSPTAALSESGALPPGVVFQANANGTATISGSPPANAAGTYQVTITASNGVGNPAVQHLVVNIGGAAVITSPASLVLQTNVYRAFTVTASGSPTPALTESGTLPPGMVFHANGNGTATISGAPPASASSTYVVTITASNGVGHPAVQYLVISFYERTAGYWLATANGQVYGLGGANSYGGAPTSAAPVVGIAGTPSAEGYWVATANGSVSAHGVARYYGDLPGLGKHVSDIVAIAPTSDGEGYYLVGADGGFFTFGDARFHGSLPGVGVHVHDVVGMVATPGGAGYMLVGSDGGVFTFGTSHFYGSLPGQGHHVHDIRAILPSSTARGYVLVGSDGGVFNFGSGVKFYGSLPSIGVRVSDIVGIALTPDDGGYYMAGANGHVYGFGNAHPWAEPADLSSNLPVAAIAGT